MPDIYLFRHAHVDYKPPAQITARNPLTPLGEEMAARLAERCDPWQLEHLFVSPLLRCQQTAAALLRRFDGLTWSLAEDFAEVTLSDLADFDGVKPPEDMHTWEDAHFAHANAVMWDRCQRGWAEVERYVAENDLQRVAIVSHGGPINALIRMFMGQPVERLRTCWYDLDWSTTSCLRYGEGRKSVRWVNDARHIDALRDRLG